MSIIIRLQNLPWSANSTDIRRFFGGLEIPDGGVHIIGGEKGNAFIAFKNDDDARLAMQKDGDRIKDSRIRLYLSSRSEMQQLIDEVRKGSTDKEVKDQRPSRERRKSQERDRSTRKERSLSRNRRQSPKRSFRGRSRSPLRRSSRERHRSAERISRRRERSPIRSDRRSSPKRTARDRSKSPYQKYSEKNRERDQHLRKDSRSRTTYHSAERKKDDRHRSVHDSKVNRSSNFNDENFTSSPFRSHLRETESLRDNIENRNRQPEVKFVESSALYDRRSPINLYREGSPQVNIPLGQSDYVSRMESTHQNVLKSSDLGLNFKDFPNRNSSAAQGMFSDMQMLNKESDFLMPSEQFNRVEKFPSDIDSNIWARKMEGWNTASGGHEISRSFERETSRRETEANPVISFEYATRSHEKANTNIMHDNFLRNSNSAAMRNDPAVWNQFDPQVSRQLMHDSRNTFFPEDNFSSEMPPNYCVQISGLGSNANFKDVQSMLKDVYAPPQNIKWEITEGGYKTGTAYVKLSNKDDYCDVLQRPPYFFDGHPLAVNKCPDDIYRNRFVQQERSNFLRNSQDFCYMLKGLPYSTEERDIIEFFKGLQIVDLLVLYDKADRATGTGYVEFATFNDYQSALERNGKRIGHRYIELITATKENIAEARKAAGLDPTPKNLLAGDNQIEPFSNWGEKQMHEPVRQRPPTKRPLCALLAGLPPNIRNYQISDFFKECGLKPDAIHIILGMNRKPSGRAFVEFLDPLDFDAALKRHGKSIGGNTISVKQVLYEEMLNILDTSRVRHDFSTRSAAYGNEREAIAVPEKVPYLWEPPDTNNELEPGKASGFSAADKYDFKSRSDRDIQNAPFFARNERFPMNDRRSEFFKNQHDFYQRDQAVSRPGGNFNLNLEKGSSHSFDYLHARPFEEFPVARERQQFERYGNECTFNPAKSFPNVEPVLNQQFNLGASSRFPGNLTSENNSDNFRVDNFSSSKYNSAQYSSGIEPLAPPPFMIENSLREREPVKFEMKTRQQLSANTKADAAFDRFSKDQDRKKLRKLSPVKYEEHSSNERKNDKYESYIKEKDMKRDSKISDDRQKASERNSSSSQQKTDEEVKSKDRRPENHGFQNKRSSNTRAPKGSSRYQRNSFGNSHITDSEANFFSEPSYPPTDSESLNRMPYPSNNPSVLPDKFSCTVQASNVHPDVGLMELLDFFRGFGLVGDNIIRRFTEFGEPTGDVRITFQSPDDAQQAIRFLDKQPLRGIPIDLFMVF